MCASGHVSGYVLFWGVVRGMLQVMPESCLKGALGAHASVFSQGLYRNAVRAHPDRDAACAHPDLRNSLSKSSCIAMDNCTPQSTTLGFLFSTTLAEILGSPSTDTDEAVIVQTLNP